MSHPALPADGPEAVLLHLLRRFRVPHQRGYVSRAVANHPRPNSLLALVEVATGAGLTVKPYRADASALDDLSPPMVVHVGDDASVGGFGVIEAVTEDGVEVWDSAGGRRRIDREAFVEHWSGIVAVVEPDSARRHGSGAYLRSRVADVLWGALSPPAVTGGPAALVLRAAVGGLVAVLVALAVAARPPNERAAAVALAVLTGIGLGLTLLMSASMGEGTPFASRVCARGRLVDCENVLSSRYARIFGIPLSDIGIAVFGGLLLLLAAGAVADHPAPTWTAAAAVYILAAPLALLLVGAQLAIRRLCSLCLAVHAVVLAGAAVGWLVFRPDGWVPRATPAALLGTLCFLLVLFFGIPYVRTSRGLALLATRHHRASASPFAALAQVLTEAPTGIRGPECGVALAGSGAPHEVVVFVHPSCTGCDPVLREIRSIVTDPQARVFVALAPKDPGGPDGRMCEAIVAAGVALGAERMLEAYAAAKTHLRGMAREDPLDVIAAECGVSRDAIAAALEEARRLVRRADELAADHVEGTPAVFLDGRPYQGWLAHLGVLLAHHPDLLEPLTSTEPERTSPA